MAGQFTLLRDEIEGCLLLLGKQRLAFLALAPNLLNQLGIAHQIRLNRVDIIFHALPAPADMPQLIAENNHICPQLFHRLGNNREGVLYRLCQLPDRSFQLPQQGIVRLDLPVDLAAVSNDPFPLQRPCGHSLMDGRLLIQTSGCVAAVVDSLRPSGALQIEIGHIRPCSPPCHKLLLTIPTFGDGVLSAVAGALRMLVSPDESLRLGSRRCHIDLLFADLVGLSLIHI